MQSVQEVSVVLYPFTVVAVSPDTEW